MINVFSHVTSFQKLSLFMQNWKIYHCPLCSQKEMGLPCSEANSIILCVMIPPEEICSHALWMYLPRPPSHPGQVDVLLSKQGELSWCEEAFGRTGSYRFWKGTTIWKRTDVKPRGVGFCCLFTWGLCWRLFVSIFLPVWSKALWVFSCDRLPCPCLFCQQGTGRVRLTPADTTQFVSECYLGLLPTDMVFCILVPVTTSCSPSLHSHTPHCSDCSYKKNLLTKRGNPDTIMFATTTAKTIYKKAIILLIICFHDRF